MKTVDQHNPPTRMVLHLRMGGFIHQQSTSALSSLLTLELPRRPQTSPRARSCPCGQKEGEGTDVSARDGQRISSSRKGSERRCRRTSAAQPRTQAVKWLPSHLGGKAVNKTRWKHHGVAARAKILTKICTQVVSGLP